MAVIDLSGFGKWLHSKGTGNKAVNRTAQPFTASLDRSGKTFSAGASAGSVKDSFQLAKSISELLSPACGMTEEEKSAYLGHIRAKLMAGKKLTDEEMRFLQAECPELYIQAARVQNMRASFEQQLKSCKSREEAASLFSHSMSMIGEEDPMKEAITAAYQEVYQEFQSTGNDSSLPQTAEEDREKGDVPIHKILKADIHICSVFMSLNHFFLVLLFQNSSSETVTSQQPIFQRVSQLPI